MKGTSTIVLVLFALAACQPPEPAADMEPMATGPSENAVHIQGMYDAFAEGNVEAVVAAMSPEIVWNEAENFIYADGNPYVGPDSVVSGVFARLGSEWASFNLDIQNVIDGDDQIVVTGRYKGQYKATGKELDAQFAHVWSVENGKATSFQQYTDTKQAAEVVMAK